MAGEAARVHKQRGKSTRGATLIYARLKKHKHMTAAVATYLRMVSMVPRDPKQDAALP